MRNGIVNAKRIVALMICLGASPSSVSAETVFGQFLTGSTGGVWDILGSSMTNVINQNVEGVRLNPSNPPSTSLNPPAVDSGRAFFAITSADTLDRATKGLGEYEKPHGDISFVMSLYQNIMVPVVLDSSDIERLDQVRGKRVAVPSESTKRMMVDMYLIAGVPEDEINWSYLNYTEMSAALKDGTIDVGTFTGYPRNGGVEEMAATSGIRFLSAGPEVEKVWNVRNPKTQMATIPGGTYPGIDEDTRSYALFINLITNKNVDAKTIQDVVKAIYANQEAIAASHPAGNSISPEGTVSDIRGGIVDAGLIHPGTIEYFKLNGVDITAVE